LTNCAGAGRTPSAAVNGTAIKQAVRNDRAIGEMVLKACGSPLV
jgi:hypothetical protein